MVQNRVSVQKLITPSLYLRFPREIGFGPLHGGNPRALSPKKWVWVVEMVVMPTGGGGSRRRNGFVWLMWVLQAMRWADGDVVVGDGAGAGEGLRFWWPP